MDNIEIGDLVKLREVWTPNTKLIGIVMDYRDPAEDDGSDCSLIGIRQYLIQGATENNGKRKPKTSRSLKKKKKTLPFDLTNTPTVIHYLCNQQERRQHGSRKSGKIQGWRLYRYRIRNWCQPSRKTESTCPVAQPS